ncbi:hypothetical protein [Dyadobacter chenhuakuii]|uniref:Uncharacterized protein n=1 Tax=Dyadobacter chenhuakuii TaxID=2909339 RepID=A0ABY4XQV4_9BACT|nr:hypothetical protein [Dyadobacter chenhuakuii]MCF2492884.1 hypothetical protein [Dyadobacter chenhuakuii]USJ32827.1 hypothetical protein NFI80_08760 [Dyadobacter chenhuakuii]
MHLSYSKIGAASVAMVLAEMEDIFQKREAHEIDGMPATRQQADFDVYANFLNENAIVLGGTGAVHDQQTLVNTPIKINQSAKNRFLSILSRVTKAHEGVSRQERLFVHWFWSQIQSSLLHRP